MMFQLVEVSNTVRKIERGLNSFCLLLIEEKSYLLKYELTESKETVVWNSGICKSYKLQQWHIKYCETFFCVWYNQNSNRLSLKI